MLHPRPQAHHIMLPVKMRHKTTVKAAAAKPVRMRHKTLGLYTKGRRPSVVTQQATVLLLKPEDLAIKLVFRNRITCSSIQSFTAAIAQYRALAPCLLHSKSDSNGVLNNITDLPPGPYQEKKKTQGMRIKVLVSIISINCFMGENEWLTVI